MGFYGYLETGEETIMRSAWPLYDPARDYPEEEQRIEWAKDVVRAVRLARVNMNVPAARKPHIFIGGTGQPFSHHRNQHVSVLR